MQVALELGGYIGYSAIRIARNLPPGGKLYSIEPNEKHVRIARRMIQHTGLSDKVEVLQSILEESVQASIHNIPSSTQHTTVFCRTASLTLHWLCEAMGAKSMLCFIHVLNHAQQSRSRSMLGHGCS